MRLGRRMGVVACSSRRAHSIRMEPWEGATATPPMSPSRKLCSLSDHTSSALPTSGVRGRSVTGGLRWSSRFKRLWRPSAVGGESGVGAAPPWKHSISSGSDLNEGEYFEFVRRGSFRYEFLNGSEISLMVSSPCLREGEPLLWPVALEGSCG